MSTFQAVNVDLGPQQQFHTHSIEATTPTTPRPVHANTIGTQQQQSHAKDESSPNTPTRHSFGGLPGQRPLPNSPIDTSSTFREQASGETSLKRESSILSRASQDIEMGLEGDSDEDLDGSEDESIADESGRPSKKKKGQRFFCTDYPPCQLSFTRSEHLARHIRKHTGERPFQCHCARRFSRLDNLRQHAQTVHVNEEIPTDSLAATGTRFQRQARTDRVRPTAGRSRASTVGSQSGAGHSRGHSRNLSSSSIGSGLSNLSMRDDVRRRPPPLIMANEPHPRSRLSIDTVRSPPDSPGRGELAYRGYPTQSPGGYSTPTSSTFSTGPGSPRFSGSAMQSPASRPSSMWGGPSTASGRRLSVPSGANPFHSPRGGHTGAPPPTGSAYFSPLPSSTASNFSGQSSMFGSPISSVFTNNREYASRAAQDADFKRRTWHPESRSKFGANGANTNVVSSGGGLAQNSFAHYHSNNVNRPPLLQSHSSGMGTRLPGIESFDREHDGAPSSPPRRGPSPMQVDPPLQRPPSFPGVSERAISGTSDRRSVSEWDRSLHHNLTRLDLSTSTPPKESPGPWPLSYNSPSEYHHIAAQQPHFGPARHSMPHPHRYSAGFLPLAGQPQHIVHPSSQANDQAHNTAATTILPTAISSSHSPTTPRKSKRHGWYNGPINAQQRKIAAQRTSPEDSSSSDGVPTPSTSSIGEYNPSIVHSDGRVENHVGSGAATDGAADGAHQIHRSQLRVPGSGTTSVPQATQPKGEGDLMRLEALVAAATSEEGAVEKRLDI